MDNTAKGFAKELISELRRIKKALSFLSEVSEPGKDNKQSPNPKDCTDPEHVSAGWKPLAFTGVDPSPHSTSEAKHKRYRSLQWWKSRTEFVATFFVIGYAVVTFFQWRDAHADFRKDQRAWVGAIKIGPIPEIGKPLTVTITFKNSGKTPALMVSPYYSFQFVNKGDEFRFTVKRTYGHEIIAPNVEAPGVIPLADAKVRMVRCLNAGKLRKLPQHRRIFGPGRNRLQLICVGNLSCCSAHCVSRLGVPNNVNDFGRAVANAFGR